MAESVEFEIEGFTYRIGTLSAFQQFHLQRKIAPLIPPLIPVFMQISKEKGLSEDITRLPELVQPFADALAAMTDESAEAVLNTCLSALTRKTNVGDRFVPIWLKDRKVFIPEDLQNGYQTIPLVIRVIREVLGPFIRGVLMSPPTAEAS